jgi:peroxiredoxin Q/BCP
MFKVSLFSSSLIIGENAPNFTLDDQDGNQHELKHYKGKKLVVYFFPKSFTPG